MTRPEEPTRREEARLPETGSLLTRRYAPLSLVLHLLAFALLSLPALRPERPVFAQPLYEVALVPWPEPNYEPPVPAAPPKPKPQPAKPRKEESKPKDTVPVKAAKPKPQAPVEAQTKAVEPPKAETPAKTPEAEAQPVSLGQVDQVNFREDWYLELLRSILSKSWDPPTGGSGVVSASVHFTIGRDGTIRTPEVVSPSGWSLYDRSALSAVLSVRKFPPLPEAYTEDQLGLTVNFQRVGEAP